MAQPPAAANPSGWTGNPPQLFDGNRAKSELFLRQFDMYKSMNNGITTMSNPYRRVIFALSFIRGPNIDNWVDAQLQELKTKVSRQQNPVGRDEEVLWTEFETAFKGAYTNTTQKQSTYLALQGMKMQGQNLDSFIATFKNLAKKAGYGKNDEATVDMFVKRLNRPLLDRILDRDTEPTTLAEWIDAARKEQKKNMRRDAIHHSMPRWPMQWHKGPQQQRPHRHPNDETVPMDVDTVMAAQRAVTAEDKKKHRNEGRCYNCSKQGHLACECPNKKSLQMQQCKPLKPNQKKNTKFRPRDFLRKGDHRRRFR